MGPPQVLPANFNGWDQAPQGSAPPATLPKDFSQWDDAGTSQQKSAVPSFWDTLSREGKALGSSIAGMPAAVYHAFTDPPTKDELNRLGEPSKFDTDTGKATEYNVDPVSLGMHRMITAPVEVAGKFYSDAAKGKYGDASAVESAMLNEAPEAIGQGAGAVAAGGTTKALIDSVPAVADAASKYGSVPAVADAASKYGVPIAKALGQTIDAASFNRIGKIWNAWKNLPEDIRSRGAQFTDPGAPLPETPPKELLQARGLATGGAAPKPQQAAALASVEQAPPPATSTPAAAAVPEPMSQTPDGSTIPRTLSGESALRQVLTGQDNANLLKIAKSRGINVTRESQLKPGTADNLLVNKIINDFDPDELNEIGAQFLENSRFRHAFGDVGPEAWKTMSLQTYFPDLKIPATQLARTAKAVAANMPTPAPSDDLTGILQQSLAAAKARP